MKVIVSGNAIPGYICIYIKIILDINECDSNPCSKHEKCLNFNGRYECASPMQCKVGYELNDAGDQCVGKLISKNLESGLNKKKRYLMFCFIYGIFSDPII